MPLDLDELAIALAALAAPGVVSGARLISAADVGLLHDAERAKVANAVARRQYEFASGRVLLRELLGSTDTIPVGPTRAPRLPHGAVGSLAHDRDVVVAVITRDPAITALGVDVEPAEPLSNDMARVILRADEAGIDAHLAFTLKEAAYKAWSTGGGRMLDHHEVRLRIDGDCFTATVVPDGGELPGRFATVAGRHLALVHVS